MRLDLPRADGVAMDADAVVVIGKDPMRLAMMTAIVRRAGHGVDIADTEEKIDTAMAGNCLTLLVDASAWQHIVGRVDESVDSSHRILIVGDGGGEMPMHHAGRVEVVAFSRNAILAALRLPSKSANVLGGPHSALPAAADVGIERDCKGLEPKRSARMSRK